MASNDLPFDVTRKFEILCKSDPEKSEAVAAIEVLVQLLNCSEVSTVQGLHDVMNSAIVKMCENELSNLSVKSACELFQRFITLVSLDTVDFESCKKVLLERARVFIEKVGLCRQHIAENFFSHIPSGAKLFLHSYSRVVLKALSYASNNNIGHKNLHCYVTQCMPYGSGAKMMKALAKLKISCTLVPDLAMAYLMPQIDMVVLGAEAVVESGGIMNVLGSSLIAMTASAFGKPVYVLAESFKFIRCFPLDQNHILDEFKWLHQSPSKSPLVNIAKENMFIPNNDDDDFQEMNTNWNLVEAHRVSIVEQKMPRVDYTNPYFITNLITDIGILTPSAVSDELIKLYL